MMRHILRSIALLTVLSVLVIPPNPHSSPATTLAQPVGTATATASQPESGLTGMPSYQDEQRILGELWAHQTRGALYHPAAVAMIPGPDLDVTYIERTPRFDYDAPKNQPAPGDVVTFTAHVKNSGIAATGPFNYVWNIDGVQTSSLMSASLAPGQEAIYPVTWVWQNGGHTIQFQADPAKLLVEETTVNNSLTISTNALAIGLWVEQSLYAWFNANQAALGIGSNSWEDWAQRQISTWNGVLANSIYPSAPQGVLDRVRLDKITVVPDGALPLAGGVPTNNPDMRDKTSDMVWGFPSRNKADGTFYFNNGFYGTNGLPNLSLADDNPFYLEYTAMHEMSHARYLIDLYAWNLNPHPGMNDVLVLRNDGSPVVPAGQMLTYDCQGAMMGCNAPPGRARFYAEEDVYQWNNIAGQRPICGNQNAPCNFGAALLNVPLDNIVRVVDSSQRPVQGAQVSIYQSVQDPTENLDTYDKLIDATPDITCITDAGGACSLGGQPFGTLNNGWDASYKGIALIRVTLGNQESFHWFYLADANLAYAQGRTQLAVYPVTFAPANVWAWGRNSSGELGNGTSTDSSLPVQVNNLHDVLAIAGGNGGSLALTSDGHVWAWGFNGNGQLGNGTTTSSTVPVQVSTLSNVTAIAEADYHSLALTSDGHVWAWGFNRDGQLGNGTITSSTVPVEVPGLDSVIAIAAGGSDSEALTSDGRVWTWGWNGYGQLGNGTTTSSTVPVEVSGLGSVIAIAAGAFHNLALGSDGHVWAWGADSNGQLGNGATVLNVNTPIQVSGLNNVTAIAGGYQHSLALTGSGQVWAWGWNLNGQLGINSTADSDVPMQVSNIGTATAIAAGYTHSMALTSDGNAWAWGYNGDGELGNGTTNESHVPVLIRNLGAVTALAGGGTHSLAIGNQVAPPTATDSPSATFTNTATSTGTLSSTPTPAIQTKTSTGTKTAIATKTPVFTKTVTPTRTPSATKTATMTKTPLPTKTATSTRTATITRTPTATKPATATKIPSKTATGTRTGTPTRTAVVSTTSTRTSTPTSSPTATTTASPTSTATQTPGLSSDWTYTANTLQVGRFNARATRLSNGRILVEGGAIFGGGSLAESEIYDPATNSWTQTGSMNSARTNQAATLLTNGKVLVAAGDASGTSAELYDPSTGQWTVTGSLNQVRGRQTATLLANGKVLVAGGYEGCMTPSAELYDPASGTWSMTGSMSTPRADAAAVLLPSGKVLVAGGDDDCPSRKFASAELYDPSTGTWSPTGSMNIPRAHFSAVLLSDGRVFAVGGDNDSGTLPTQAEIYDPSSGMWSLAGNMSVGRFFPLGDGAAVLPDGTVLVAGGNNQGTSELYHPTTNSWDPPVMLLQPQCAASMSQLNTGRVLLISGNDCTSSTVKVAEAWLP